MLPSALSLLATTSNTPHDDARWSELGLAQDHRLELLARTNSREAQCEQRAGEADLAVGGKSTGVLFLKFHKVHTHCQLLRCNMRRHHRAHTHVAQVGGTSMADWLAAALDAHKCSLCAATLAPMRAINARPSALAAP